MRQLPIGVLLSLALHVLVALGVSRLGWQPSTPVVEPQLTVVWLTTPTPPPVAEPAPAESEPIEAAPPAEDAPRGDSDERAAPTRQSTQTDERETPSPEPSSPSPGRLIDLPDVTRRAIDAVLEERERRLSYRSFSFPGTIGEQQEFAEAERHRRVEAGLQAPLTAFDSPSKGRAGLEGREATGQYVRWVTDECYQLFGASNPFLFVEPPPSTICVPTAPRDDLFENAKPTYLMDEDERRARDERAQRAERLRRPTTGAVMPLEKQ